MHTAGGAWGEEQHSPDSWIDPRSACISFGPGTVTEVADVIDALTGILKRGIRRSRTLTELGQSLQFEFEHPPDGPVILVHAMAGAGSIAVLDALLKRFPRANVYHTHYLHPDTIHDHHQRFRELHRRTGHAVLHTEFIAARTLAGRLRGPVRTPWRVITTVREPVARTVAAFFHHFQGNHPELEPGFEAEPANVDRLIELFLADDEHERGVTLEWFEREIRDVFDIDVLRHPFGGESGHATYRTAKCSLLIVRTEDLDLAGGRAITSFLDVPALRIERDGPSAEPPYADAQTRFIERIQIPDAYLDIMYGSRPARHFYSEREIAAFRARWSPD
ncbi:MAG TPA: putative capsular polysaccharide synthesis family protein [Longimicrobiales bacterium]|nr:putative capsular polysaccharide synthesis family protein [Longimicrobiales bacterium]